MTTTLDPDIEHIVSNPIDIVLVSDSAPKSPVKEVLNQPLNVLYEEGTFNSSTDSFDSENHNEINTKNPDLTSTSSALSACELFDKVNYQKLIIDECVENVKFLESKCSKLEGSRKELESKLDNAVKQRDAALKEKESMVIRYAVGEKNLIKERQLREQSDKKNRELQKEYESLQQKLHTFIGEKDRICHLLDKKCTEAKNVQQQLENTKQELNNLETKLKWSQSSLKNEIEAHRECQEKIEALKGQVQDTNNQIEKERKNAEDMVKNFYTSQENRAHVLDQQLKEQQACLILLRHDKSAKEQQLDALQGEFKRQQTKYKEVIEENNNLSLKVQQLERERLENEQKLSDLRGCEDQQRQDAANLQIKNVQVEQLKLQLKHEEEQLCASNERMSLLELRNQELESDMESCRVREAELLVFTQQLTDKNVRLQSEFTSVETKIQQLTCELSGVKRNLKDQEAKTNFLTSTLETERTSHGVENAALRDSFEGVKGRLEEAMREISDLQGENLLVKRKFDLRLKEVNKELEHCRKKLERYEIGDLSSTNSSSSLNVHSPGSETEEVKVIKPENTIDTQALIEHIVKLQRLSAKKSEKIDFLEEHINTLVAEVQKKTKLLQGYILRDQSGTLTSNTMDSNKAEVSKLQGIMASMYSSKICDQNLTLELSLDINRKLQAVLEDALLKNITLSKNIDTLGEEIHRLNQWAKK
ncbi:coiled-coil domain-containing protein 186-like isoform X1 [Euwallacea fornicatus]|uniref:coiled-coil domain-containing protein 186-like isoform X1 n=1 Tax=Euwallacea fornicatus TaxID=995702 RepID=UPI00338F0D1D